MSDCIIGDEPQHPAGQERRPVAVDFWPGEYVVISLETWEALREDVTALKKQAGVEKLNRDVIYSEFMVPDSGPRVCPFCGIDMWGHRAYCRKMFADENDPGAEY